MLSSAVIARSVCIRSAARGCGERAAAGERVCFALPAAVASIICAASVFVIVLFVFRFVSCKAIHGDVFRSLYC